MVLIDYIVFGVFLAGLFFIGSILYKWIGEPDDYFVAGRSLPPFILAATLVATNVNLYTFIGQTGAAYKEGISIVWQAWTGNMALVFSGLFVLPIFRRLRIRTVPEFLEMRYSRLVRSLVGFLWVFRLAFWLGVTMYTGAIAAETLTGIHSFTLWIIVFAFVAVSFTSLGGAWSVALTDALQFVLMLGGALIILPLAMRSVGWLPGLIEKLPEGHFEFVKMTGQYNWQFIIAISLLGIQWACTDQGMMQRAFGADSTKTIARAMVWAGVITTPFILIALLPGLVAAVTSPGLENFDMAYPILMARVLGPFILGLMVCGLMASHLSTINANLNAVATVFTSDIYSSLFNRRASKKTILFVARTATLMAGIFMIAMAYLVPRLGGAVQAYLTIVSIMDMPLFIVAVLYGLLWKRATWQGALAGYAAGALAGIIGRFVIGLDVNITTFVSAGTALVVCPLVSLMTRAVAQEKIVGIWQAKDVSQEELDNQNIFHILPRTGFGKAGLILLFTGLAVFLTGAVLGSTGQAALAGIIAVSGMILYFIGGIIKVYSN
jgi:SSS family solute:Na+ symporter